MTSQRHESGEKPFLTAEQEAVLGSELAECLTLLYVQLAPYEEWARGGDFTTIELLQALKEDGIFKDLKIIQSVGKAVQDRYSALAAEAKKRYGGNPPERAQAQALNQLTSTITALAHHDQPLMNEILNQTFNAGRSERFLSIAAGIRSRRHPTSTAGVAEEMRIKRKLEAEVDSPRIRNYADLLVFLARCRDTTLERQKLSEEKEEEADAAFKKYRWAEMELTRPGIIPEFTFAGNEGKAMGFKVAVYPTKLGEKALFEAFGARISFSVDVPHPKLKGYVTKVPIQLDVGLSRVHPEITAFANGYVSLEPLFQAYGLSGFYNRLKKELWLRVKDAETQGYCRMKEQPGTGVEVVAKTVETVSESTQANVADTLGEPQEQREKNGKGQRTTTRNISVDDVLSTLENMGISASRQNGTSHLILKGENAATRRPATCSIPVTSIGDNSGPYIARAARTFGFTRKDFLRALSGL